MNYFDYYAKRPKPLGDTIDWQPTDDGIAVQHHSEVEADRLIGKYWENVTQFADESHSIPYSGPQ